VEEPEASGGGAGDEAATPGGAAAHSRQEGASGLQGGRPGRWLLPPGRAPTLGLTTPPAVLLPWPPSSASWHAAGADCAPPRPRPCRLPKQGAQAAASLQRLRVRGGQRPAQRLGC
jgi:hypothetical protein